MLNLQQLNEFFNKYIVNLENLLPDSIYILNLELLHHFDLLHFQPQPDSKLDQGISKRFNIIETHEKVTLVNDEFIIWMYPDKSENTTLTYTLIALNRGEKEPQLEAAFIAAGVFNSSKLVLRVLEKFLSEIHELESLLTNLRTTEKGQ